MCVLRGDILGSFYSERQGAQFYHYYINGLGETLSYNGLRRIGLALNEVPCLGHCLWIPNNEFHFEVLVLYIVYCFLARDVAVSINTTYNIGCRNWIVIQPWRWIMLCVSKPTCTHVIIIWLWLTCHIHCGFSFSYLSILGIAAYDRCNISHVFAFSFQL